MHGRMSGPPNFTVPRPTPGIIGMMLALTVCYGLQLVLLRLGFGSAVQELMLVPEAVVFRGRLWQLFTSWFLHSPNSVGHLLNNLIVLWFFGTTLERTRGRRWLLTSFAWCALAGSLLTVLVGGLFAVALPGTDPAAVWYSPVVGASGGVLGLLVAWIGIHWGQTIHIFLLGAIRAETFGAIIVVIEILVALSYDGTSSTSHFGGMALGFLIGRGKWPPTGLRKKAAQRKHQKTQERLRTFEVIEGGRTGPRDDDDDTAGPPIWGGKPPTVH